MPEPADARRIMRQEGESFRDKSAPPAEKPLAESSAPVSAVTASTLRANSNEWSDTLKQPEEETTATETKKTASFSVAYDLIKHSVEGVCLTLKTGYLLLGETLGASGRAISLTAAAARGSQTLFFGFLGAGLVNNLKSGASNSTSFLGYAAGFAVVKFVVGALDAWDRRAQAMANVESSDVGYRLMRNALLSKDYESMRVANMSNAVSQANENLWRFPQYMSATLDAAAQSVALGIAGYAIYKAPWPVICCAIGAAGVSMVKNVHLARKASEDESKITDPRRRSWWLGWMTIDPASTKEVRMLGVAPDLESKRQNSRTLTNAPFFKRTHIEFLYNVVENPISAVAMAGSIYLLGGAVKAGNLDLGTASFIALAAYPTFVQTLGQLSTIFGRLLEHGPHIKHYQTIAALSPGLSRSSPTVRREGKQLAVVDRVPPAKTLEFVHAGYSYPDSSGSRVGSAPVFKNVNITLPAGAMVMICGENGVGKSTLFECLVGLRKPTEGALLINEQLPDPEAREEWAKLLGICFQDFYLFGSLTFREILTIGAPPVSDEYFNRVMEETGVKRILEERIQEGETSRPKFPKGLDSTFGAAFADGVDLSGGGRQKFAIARALLRRPAVLVLDEFTSALDPDDAERIYLFLKNAKETMGYAPTIIYSTHDYRRGKYAEQILMLSRDVDGSIKHVVGTFDELRKGDTSFARKLKSSSH
jgi:ABC-type multidrug transport system fused ATPase/permease subunit